MIEVKRIYPECCADTCLVELLLQKGKPAHYKGINNVSNALKKLDNDRLFAIGVIDTDKFKGCKDPYIKRFKIIENRLDKEDLIILKLPNTEKHLIRLHPEFEKWVWKIAINNGIDPKNYGFGSLSAFYDTTKNEEVEYNETFKRFIRAVIKTNAPQIQTLKYWLSKVFS